MADRNKPTEAARVEQGGLKRRPAKIPLMGAINEARLLAEGWRVVRDPQSGEALYEERIR